MHWLERFIHIAIGCITWVIKWHRIVLLYIWKAWSYFLVRCVIAIFVSRFVSSHGRRNCLECRAMTSAVVGLWFISQTWRGFCCVYLIFIVSEWSFLQDVSALRHLNWLWVIFKFPPLSWWSYPKLSNELDFLSRDFQLVAIFIYVFSAESIICLPLLVCR